MIGPLLIFSFGFILGGFLTFLYLTRRFARNVAKESSSKIVELKTYRD